MIAKAWGLERGAGITGPREFGGGLGVFYTLTVVITQHTCLSELIELHTKKRYIFLHVNYTSVNLTLNLNSPLGP